MNIAIAVGALILAETLVLLLITAAVYDDKCSNNNINVNTIDSRMLGQAGGLPPRLTCKKLLFTSCWLEKCQPLLLTSEHRRCFFIG